MTWKSRVGRVSKEQYPKFPGLGHLHRAEKLVLCSAMPMFNVVGMESTVGFHQGIYGESRSRPC